jgi:hypothetical protein
MQSREDLSQTRDVVKRRNIRFDNTKRRTDICIKEIAFRDDEIMQMKREIVTLKKQRGPVNASLLNIRGEEEEKARLEREHRRMIERAAVAWNAKQNAASDEVGTHLENIIIRQKQTVAKLEAQRQMLSEIERNQLMGVLGAMSLLATLQIKIVEEVLPEYSPFTRSKAIVLRDLPLRSNGGHATAEGASVRREARKRQPCLSAAHGRREEIRD